MVVDKAPLRVDSVLLLSSSLPLISPGHISFHPLPDHFPFLMLLKGVLYTPLLWLISSCTILSPHGQEDTQETGGMVEAT